MLSLKNKIAIRSGGEDLSKWISAIIHERLSPTDAVAFGGFIVPQMGSKTGERILLAPCLLQSNSEVGSLDELQIQAEHLSPSKTSELTLKQTDNEPNVNYSSSLVLQYNSILLHDELECGQVWTLTPKEDAGIGTIVSDISAYLGAAISSAKLADSMDILSTPVWQWSSSTKDTALFAAKSVRRAISCLSCIIWIADEEKKNLVKFASDGNVPKHYTLDVPFAEGVVGYCHENPETIIVDDMSDEEAIKKKYGISGVYHQNLVEKFGWKSGIFVPLDAGGSTIGVLAAYGLRERGFSEIEREVISVFAQRLTASYVHVLNSEQLADLEANLRKEGPAIRTGILAIRRVHDADNEIAMAQSSLSALTTRNKNEPTSNNYKDAMSASKHIDFAHKILREMVSEARRYEKLVLANRNMMEYLKHIISRYDNDVDAANVHISLKGDENTRVRIDPGQFSRAISNIVENALEFLKVDRKGGKKKIDISFNQTGPFTDLIIEDNGPGIEMGKEEAVFKSFYTTRPKKGLGFGLWIAQDIVQKHGGLITVESKWGHWTRFKVRFKSFN